MSHSFTLKQRIGQRIIAGIDGLRLTDAEKEFIDKYSIGNFILFSNNVRDAEQVAALCQELDHAAREASGVGAFIAIDQEGGRVSRLPKGMLPLPSARSIADAGDTDAAYAYAKRTGETLKSLGINFNLAPVLDMSGGNANSIVGDRSFGSTPEAVEKFALPTMRGLCDGGVLCCGKHFPGHGGTTVDSHVDMPTIDGTREELERTHIRPFVTAIAAGIPAIMSSHILFPVLASDGKPATLSRCVLTDYLRGALGFDGLILTDCLEMGAIAKRYTTAAAAPMAARAGASMFTISHSHEAAAACADALYTAYADGTLLMDEMDAEIDRILKHKEDVLSK